MEKRAILAAVLMAVVLIIYQTFFIPSAPPPAPEPAAQAPKGQAPVPGPVAAPAPAPPAPPPSPAAPSTPPAPRPPQRTVAVETVPYRAVISSEGGKLQEWTLHYRGAKPMVIVGELGSHGLAVGPANAPAAEAVPMAITPEGGLKLGGETRSGALELNGETDGLKVRQTLEFDASTYAYETRIRVENSTTAPKSVSVTLPWSTKTDWQGVTEKYLGQHPTELTWSADGVVHLADTLTAVADQELTGSWIGMGSVWYLAALVPKSPDFKLVTRTEKGTPAKVGEAPPVTRVTMAVRATPTIAPGQAWEGTVLVYVGPKEYDRLAAYGLEATINFGGFPVPRSWGGLPMEWLGVPILRLMNWVYDHVGNYGVAIILITVLSKVLFYPLTVKSMRSMKAMQALQPQMNALRNKYKSDPQRMQRETLDLYRKHKVNPAGGCLPMIAQVPIFYALYLALSVSVELQGATFFCFGRIFGVDLWICDLASQDPTYVLPVLMGVTMFIQQKMMPVMGDPRQAKLMLIMPFIFTFMFINLPSGLVLYWTVSNILQILQQWYMDRPTARGRAREAKEAGRA
ncbi:MAG: membrane protein insertase YidC [Candidatus Rokubacteria bacterium]|nr:membrane protein insertase YidC [Candidatus Rokubacteria bacterium]